MTESKADVFLALDVDTKKEAFSLVEKWSSYILGFKIGPRLGFQLTQSEWRWFSKKGKIFIDYKFFDIPSTVLNSVRAVFKSEASFCTVHALNGLECLRGLAKLEKELNQIRPFKILVVTLLTSFDQEENTLPLFKHMKPDRIVKDLSNLTFESGLLGLVCSPKEVLTVKRKYPKGIFVTPGIRFINEDKEDQKRVSTPERAWADGATYLVMGRSLIRTRNFNKTVNKLKLAWQTA